MRVFESGFESVSINFVIIVGIVLFWIGIILFLVVLCLEVVEK